MANANVDRDWEGKYRAGETRWDSGLASGELRRCWRSGGLRQAARRPGLRDRDECGVPGDAGLRGDGCGFAAALELARGKADAAGVRVEWIEADVQHFGAGLEPFDLVFDRGCYHCCRRVDLDGYRETLLNVMRPGTRLLLLCGNANEQAEEGPPRVTEQEIRDELGSLIDFEFIREFRFEDAGGVNGPLGWSCFGVRRVATE